MSSVKSPFLHLLFHTKTAILRKSKKESLKLWCFLTERCFLNTCAFQHWSHLGSSTWHPSCSRTTGLGSLSLHLRALLLCSTMGHGKIWQLDCSAEIRWSSCWMTFRCACSSSLISCCFGSCFNDISILPTKLCSTSDTWYNSRVTEEIRKK